MYGIQPFEFVVVKIGCLPETKTDKLQEFNYWMPSLHKPYRVAPLIIGSIFGLTEIDCEKTKVRFLLQK